MYNHFSIDIPTGSAIHIGMKLIGQYAPKYLLILSF